MLSFHTFTRTKQNKSSALVQRVWCICPVQISAWQTLSSWGSKAAAICALSSHCISHLSLRCHVWIPLCALATPGCEAGRWQGRATDLNVTPALTLLLITTAATLRIFGSDVCWLEGTEKFRTEKMYFFFSCVMYYSDVCKPVLQKQKNSTEVKMSNSLETPEAL